jgi:hypothetical protein
MTRDLEAEADRIIDAMIATGERVEWPDKDHVIEPWLMPPDELRSLLADIERTDPDRANRIRFFVELNRRPQ